MKKKFVFILIAFLASSLHADNLTTFQKYEQRADTAFKHGDTSLCFRIQEDIISLYNFKHKKNAKNKKICTIAFNAYSSLALLDKRKSKKEICNLLSNGLTIIEDNNSWLKEYSNKKHIIDCFINLISIYNDLGETESACSYIQKMIFFTEQNYKFEIADVLLSASYMYLLINKEEKNYPIYQRLYKMLNELDKHQQYNVVTRLIYHEFTQENYAELAKLALKHEGIITKSKDENKEAVYKLIGLGFKRNAIKLAQKHDNNYSAAVDSAYKTGCEWTQRNSFRLYTQNIFEYACWLYRFDKYKIKAVEQFKIYLKAVENNYERPIISNRFFCHIENAELALIYLLRQEMMESPTPKKLNDILSEYPKTIADIKNSPNSEYYDDLIKIIEFTKK